MSWLSVVGTNDETTETVEVQIETSPSKDAAAQTPTPPSRPPADPTIARVLAARQEALLWCLQHRGVRMRTASITSSAPGDFGVPDVPVRPPALPWYGRSDANDFCRGFVSETLKRASADPRCRMLTACDVIGPSGEYRRVGPYLWARLDGDNWALIEIDLWPQLRLGSCWRPLDLFGTLGRVSTVEDEELAAQASALLGPNDYAGISTCTAW